LSGLKKLRNRFERFCYQNRTRGIPNLMLFITLGSALVYVMSMMDNSQTLYRILCFNRDAILQGQIWRLFTYVFTYSAGSVLLTTVSLICYYSLGRAMENVWGTLRFNLFYLTGVVMMDVFCLCFGGNADAYYLNLSLFLGYATLYPNAHFLLFFIIPVKAWIFALFDLAVTVYDVINLTAHGYIPYNLFPLVAIGNYLLFFGKDVLNIIPITWRINASRLFKKKNKSAPKKTGPIPFSAGSYQASTATVKQPYTHKCTVCGRTDVTNPELEFRYCSRCNGYHCYCEDHINNHTHVE
jgi:membrane associated rhomboid family serine protease